MTDSARIGWAFGCLCIVFTGIRTAVVLWPIEPFFGVVVGALITMNAAGIFVRRVLP